jgi:hypothetical protein
MRTRSSSSPSASSPLAHDVPLRTSPSYCTDCRSIDGHKTVLSTERRLEEATRSLGYLGELEAAVVCPSLPAEPS